MKVNNKISDLVVWLLFVAITTGVWVGHALNSVRNAHVPVEVVYTGLPETVGTSEPLPTRVHVKVRDMGRRLQDVYMSNPQVTIDLKDQVRKEKGEIVVTSDVIRHALSDMLPGTANIQDVDPQEIRVSYHYQRAKTVPVLGDVSIHPSAQYQASGALELEPALVTIYGSKAQLDTTHYILTERLVVQNARDTLRKTLKLRVPEGLRASETKVELTQPIEQYTEKSLQAAIRVKGAPQGKMIHLFPSTVSVRVQLPVRHYQDVNEKDVTASVDYPHNQESVLTVKAQCSSKFAGRISVQPQEVEYLIETIGSEE